MAATLSPLQSSKADHPTEEHRPHPWAWMFVGYGTLPAMLGAWLGLGDGQEAKLLGSRDAPYSQSTNIRIAPVPLLQQKRVLSYPYTQVWPTALRYIRIDRDYKITDRDQEAGYIIFEFPTDGGAMGSGNLEFIQTHDSSGRDSVVVIVNTGAGPSYLPNSILDGMGSKIREERGQPIAPPPGGKPPPPSEPPGPETDDKQPKGPPMMPPPINP